ncbi:Rieske 2Fe-2S domain-containing protein [Massilia sp. W12]|uniref:Rieske (2Fe-2S) protein n=1 Tax=Massilia sp. W12 TaxID=3126507 RepID=UPI0030CF3EEE
MTQAVYLGQADSITECGPGLRFDLMAGGDKASGFVVRYHGKLYAYLNRCQHVPIELDWEAGQFFESGKRFIMCSTHGAIYQPESGQCAGGPCRGGRLRQLQIQEQDGAVYWLPDDYCRPAPAAGGV